MIYIVSHKPVSLPTLEGYQPIQVGFDGENYPGFCRDNAGDSIAERNGSFCELTAMYWIWKNRNDAHKGLVHYRRFFGRRALSRRVGDICTYDELVGHLNDHDIILAKPARYHVDAARQLCMESCSRENYDAFRRVFLGLYPACGPAFERFFAGNRAAQYNMLFCRGEAFDAYCAWLFPLLFALEGELDLSRATAYQKRVFGFLGERLLNVWVAHNGLKAKYLPVVNTENTLRDDLTYLRRDITNEIRFRLDSGR